jgi:hypothetical protein
MKKRLISRLMNERVSGIRSYAGYFFCGNFKDVIRGVAFDYVPRGLYIENFRFPLFDPFGPNLLYSTRLIGRSFIGKGEMSEEDVVNFAISSPEGQGAFSSRKLDELPDFISFVESTPGLLKNTHARLVHAAALALLGQESRAAGLLDEIVPVLSEKDLQYCNILRASLLKGSAAAKAFLNQVRQENLNLLGIISPM